MREKYAAAGVDISKKDELIGRISPAVRRTCDARVLGGLGHFGGFFDVSALKGYDEPVLVACTDGIGTKLMLALEAGTPEALQGVGQDLVAMCVNDLICCGAEPLFFLDYYASGELDVEGAAAFLEGVADACEESGCALIGGETAQMPGLYEGKHFDAAGFCVGVVERGKTLGPEKVTPGLTLIGLPSSGFHSNGYSLVRKHCGAPSAELLAPTRLYVKPVLAVQKALGEDLRAAANITGGGLFENIPRALPEGVAAELDPGSWSVPKVMREIAKAAGMSEQEIRATFNAGLGLVLFVEDARADEALKILVAGGIEARRIGRTISGERGLKFIVTGAEG